MNQPAIRSLVSVFIFGFQLLACSSGGDDASATASDRLHAGDGTARADPPTYEACAGKACGERCSICPPDDPSCVETTDIKVCHVDGTCSSASATCDPPKYDPCEGKACGDACSICSPDDPSCVETADFKVCQADGACNSSAPSCSPSNYDPCAGKACGDACTVCPPGESDCFEAAVLKQCDSQGKCAMAGGVECK